jgi:hypothetical protein
MSPHELLIKARALIADEDRWVRWVDRRRQPDGGYAYCAIGAINWTARAAEPRVCSEWSREAKGAYLGAVRVLECVMRERFGQQDEWRGIIPDFNNSRSHAEVLEAFDYAIECADPAVPA